MIDFNDVVDKRCEFVKEVLQKKAKEYARGGDRFHNFNEAAKILNTTPEKALRAFMVKHEVSVIDLIEKANDYTFKKDVSCELIEEKIGDMINYLILLEGLLKKRLDE